MGPTLRQKAWGQVSKCAICGPIDRPTESGGGGAGAGGKSYRRSVIAALEPKMLVSCSS